MKKYDVTFYYHSSVTVTVEAEDEESAIDIARDEVCDPKYDETILRNIEEDNDPDVEEVTEEQ